MKLAEAQAIGEHLARLWTPFVERLEIAGSVRRKKPEVKDLEVVLIPRRVEIRVPGELYPQEVNALHEGLLHGRICTGCARLVPCMGWCGCNVEVRAHSIEAIKPGSQEIEPDLRWAEKGENKYWRLYLPRKMLKVDVFLVSPETWGLLYMIRTGSGVGPGGNPHLGFAPAMLRRWKRLTGGHAEEGRLVTGDGQVLETPEEEDVFRAVRLRMVDPRDRQTSRIPETAPWA